MQTGSGKTYTINGAPEDLGLTPRAVKELFRALNRDKNKFSFAVHCYMLELYQVGSGGRIHVCEQHVPCL